MIQQDPTNKTTRPGCSRNGSETNTEETIPMLTDEATALIERAATELPALPAEPTVLAAPLWATKTIAGGIYESCHVYESPVTIGVLSDLTGRPVVRCGIGLAQLDYYRVVDGRVLSTDRDITTIDITFPNAFVSVSIDEARVMRAVLGGLIARYDSAESPSSPSRQVGPWPCLPGCTEAHEGKEYHECHVQEHIGRSRTDVPNASIGVEAIGGTENATLWPTVLMDRTDLHPDTAAQMSSIQARELAALLIAGADKADALVVRPAATTTPAGA